MASDWINSLKVAELKEELKKREQPVTGNKTELVERLVAYIKEHELQSGPTEGVGGIENDQPDAGVRTEDASIPPETDAAAAPAEFTNVQADGTEKEIVSLDALPVEVHVTPADEVDENRESKDAGASQHEPTAQVKEIESENKPAVQGTHVISSEMPEQPSVPPSYGGEKETLSEPPHKKPRVQEGLNRPLASTTDTASAAVINDLKTTSRALRIEGFVRPFTLPQARELFSEHGKVLAFWMPSIKNLAYIIFATKAEAEAALSALNGLQWPAGSPKRLAPRYVPLREAETSIGNGAGNPDFSVERTEEDGPDDVEPVFVSPPTTGLGATAVGQPANIGPGPSGGKINKQKGGGDLRELLSRRTKKDEEKVEIEQAGVTLDDLFRRTQAKPAIYWLPLSDKEAEEKRLARARAG